MDLPIHIVICANDDYGDYATALVASILDNSLYKKSITIHLFNRKSDSKLYSTLHKVVGSCGASIRGNAHSRMAV